MLDDVFALFRGYNLIIREWGNGIVYPLCACMLVVIVCFFARSYYADPQGWRERKGMDTAWVFFGFFLAEGLRAVSAWVPLDAVNEGRKLSPFTEDLVSLGFALGVLLMVLMLLRSVWVYSPTERRALAVALAVAVTAVTLAFANSLQ